MRLFLRIIGLFLETLILPVILLGGTIYFMGETSAGLQTSLKIIGKLLPGELSVQHAQGKLLSQFTLNNISYHDATTDLAIQFFEFKWRPKLLLETKLDIQHLIAHNVILKSNSASAPSKPFTFEQIPFYLKHIRVNQVQITNLTYTGSDNEPLNIIAMDLTQNDTENFSFSAELLNGGIQGTIAKEWNAKWHFQIPDLGKLVPNTRGALALSGTLSGPRMTPTIRADLRAQKLFLNDDTINQLNGKINLIIKPDATSNLTVTASGIKIQNHVFQDTAMSISGQTHVLPKQFETALVIALNKKPYLNILVRMPKDFDIKRYAELPIYAKINADAINLQTLAHYVPDVKNLRGNLLGSLEMQGTLSTPHFKGELSVDNGNFTLPVLGVTFKNISLHALGDESRLLHYTGTLRAGPGTATLQGATDFSQKDFPSTLHVQGNNLQLVNLEEYKLQASPDLTVALAANILSVHGKIFVPEAKIAPKYFNGIVTLPADVVFVGEKKKANASSMLDYLPALQITVTLGDKIYLHYQDLEADLKGSVIISKEAHSPATGVGELYATKGTYNAYKKVLTINQGRLVYTGNVVTDPGLNIKASREMKTVSTGAISGFSKVQAYTGTETITIGVQVLGTLEKPVISLYSVPALSQVDVLSYLILGVPSTQVTGSSNQALLSAASALNFGGNGSTNLASITQNIQKTFGLSEMNVESVQTFDQDTGNTVGKTSLVLGKQITPNLYAHYSTSFDLLNPVSTFHLRYKLSKRFSIQSETSTIDTGADLLYSIERG
jgi:translocation and assembly module TamB